MQRCNFGQQAAVPDQCGAQCLRLGQQLAQAHDAALAKAAQHHPLGRNIELLRRLLNRLLYKRARLLLLRHIDVARAVGIHRELKPRIRPHAHGKRRAQADDMKLRRHIARESKQVLLVAAHTMHEHQQPCGLPGGGLSRPL